MKKILSWVDDHLLTILTAILIVVIPLYPKLPLADLLPGYIVRMRLEDILIGFTAFVYFTHLLRRKLVLPNNLLTKLIIGYIIIGALSSLSAIFITQTVPLEQTHILKLLLHYVRRIEYFSLFFIAYSSIRTKSDLKLFVGIALSTLVLAIIYGFGQKYLYWPAFSTMNREFSKGMRLYLTPTSRVMSTFGGHYDYAAYLMILLTGLIPAIWLTHKKLVKLALGIIAFASYWSLLLTSSRSSFIGYIIGVFAIALLLAKYKGFWWAAKRYFLLMFVSLVMMLTIGDLATRFSQIVQSPSTIHRILPFIETGKIEEAMFKTKDVFLKLGEIRRRLTEPSSKPPAGGISTDELAQVAVPSDIPPSPNKPLPPDVTQAEDDLRNRLATESSTATVSAGSSYSENAIKYGLSAAIRLDVLWPRAISAFKENPLLGTGYSTLVKSQNTEFTQAESTDNDYLRMLGETGLLGTIFFLALPLLLIYQSIVRYQEVDGLTTRTLLLAALGSSIAMLVSAIYIDVFESSKVAYTYWILAALTWRAIELSKGKYAKN